MELKQAITFQIRQIPREECARVIENFARRLQVCRQRGGGHLEHILGGKIMHKLYFVRNKVQLITSNISRLIRVFDMLLFLCHPV